MRCRWLLANLLWLAATAIAGGSANYAREDRWASEIVPAVVVGEPVYLATPERPRVLALYTEVARAKVGIVLFHGAGAHPDWGVIGALRARLADAGFATLAIQMPVLDADAPGAAYAELFPEAGDRIAAGIAFLRGRGIAAVAIVAHSMGAAMANAYLAQSGVAKIDAWVPIGMQVDFAAPPREPVLDVMAEHDLVEVFKAAPSRSMKLPHDACSRQITFAGADHYFGGSEAALAVALAPFLARAFARSC
jgi:alpha/beta superfamily hydrolase